VRASVRFLVTSPWEARVFVTGFHGIGFVGYLAVKHLVVNCERIGFITTNPEPPVVAQSSNRVVTPGELYGCDRGVVAALFNFGIPDAIVIPMARRLASWVVSNGFEESILFGGLDGRLRRSPNDLLRISTTTAYLRSGLPTAGAQHMEEGLNIIGPLAVLMEEFEKLEFPAITVLPYADITRPDPIAASVALEYFSALTGLRVDTSRLRELASEIERELEELKKLEEKVRAPSTLHYI